jgi:hypothetical protein
MARSGVGRLWPLGLLAALVLFPFGWLGAQWPPLGQVLDVVFATNQAHAVGHAVLFGLLGLALLSALPPLRGRLDRYLGVVLAAGIGQEAFQLLYKGRALAPDDFRDLAVDLTAALAVFLAWWVWRRARPAGEGRR